MVFPYVYIVKQHQLDLAVSQLSSMPRIAVDTEFSGFYTYFQELCLIQISADPYHYIIDALCGLHLESLGELFARKDILKIFHSAASDIIELRSAYNWQFSNVFDTMLACRILGYESYSLAAAVKLLGINLEKKEQKSNWKKRPLSRAQLDYAHLDTAYLEKLVEIFEKELREFGLLEEAQAEFESIATRSIRTEKQFDPEGWIKIPGALQLRPEERARLKRLYELRDHRARKENIASFRLAPNEALLRIAKEKGQQLDAMRDINPLFLKADRDRIQLALAEGGEIKDAMLPAIEQMDPESLALFKELKKWRQKTGEFRGMDHALILSNRVLLEIAEKKPTTLDNLREMDLMTDWKIRQYGQCLLDLVQGKKAVIPDNLTVLPEHRRLKMGASLKSAI